MDNQNQNQPAVETKPVPPGLDTNTRVKNIESMLAEFSTRVSQLGAQPTVAELKVLVENGAGIKEELEGMKAILAEFSTRVSQLGAQPTAGIKEELEGMKAILAEATRPNPAAHYWGVLTERQQEQLCAGKSVMVSSGWDIVPILSTIKCFRDGQYARGVKEAALELGVLTLAIFKLVAWFRA